MPISTCNIIIDKHGQEVATHGSIAFPIACYDDDININPVPWHWHEELEAVFVTEGALLLGCGNEQYVVHAGEGFFINTGIPHGCSAYQSESCRIHSIVFHPKLVGGAQDSVFFSKIFASFNGEAECRKSVPFVTIAVAGRSYPSCRLCMALCAQGVNGL